jgi:hypothetical protein
MKDCHWEQVICTGRILNEWEICGEGWYMGAKLMLMCFHWNLQAGET